MNKTITVILMMLPTLVFAEWNIDEPALEIDGPLSGEIFGNPFELGDAKWSAHALTLQSAQKSGHWPESELIIFVGKDEQKEWVVTPGQESQEIPHIHMRFAREDQDFPSTLMYTEEYSMRLQVIDVADDAVSLKIHLSLPDYKKSFLIGEFTAVIEG